MDIVFGSSGVAVADQERMAQINREIGLESHLHGDQHSDDDKNGAMLDEKAARCLGTMVQYLCRHTQATDVRVVWTLIRFSLQRKEFVHSVADLLKVLPLL